MRGHQHAKDERIQVPHSDNHPTQYTATFWIIFFLSVCVCVCCFYAQEAKQPATEFQHDEKSTYPTPIRWAG